MGLHTFRVANEITETVVVECLGVSDRAKFVTELELTVALESLDVVVSSDGGYLANVLIAATLENRAGQSVADAWNFDNGDFTSARIASELADAYTRETGDEPVDVGAIESAVSSMLDRLL